MPINKQREKKVLIAASSFLFQNPQSSLSEELLADLLDWNYLLVTSHQHGISPLLFKSLADSGLAHYVPPETYQHLKRNYLSSLMNNNRLLRELASMLDLFSEFEVPVLVLKGAALCQTVYPDISLRPFGDLDILISKEHVPRCQQELQDIDFHLVKGIYFPLSDDQNDRLGCEWAYHRNNTVVELHWNLINSLAPFRINIGLFWQDAVELKFEGRPAFSMSPENQLLHLCLHQYKHHWERMRDLIDVALVIQRFQNELDWEMIYWRSDIQGLNHCVYYNLTLAQEVLGLPIPHLETKRLINRAKPSAFSTALVSLISDNIYATHMPRRFWELLSVDAFGDKLTVVKNILSHPFPREDDNGLPQSESVTTIRGKVQKALGSFFFYRRLLLTFTRKLFYSWWRTEG